MRFDKALPYPSIHKCEEDYVDALLDFVTTSEILQTLCGGVHILDFLTRDPDLFEAILLVEWRVWLRLSKIPDVLDLLMREDLGTIFEFYDRETRSCDVHELHGSHDGSFAQWRGGPLPPKSLLHYILKVRELSLDRSFKAKAKVKASDIPNAHSLSRQLTIGMKPKKAHEVKNFAAFVNSLVSELGATNTHKITHVVDFGSGQNYLGRVLASPVYDRRVVAVESKEANITGAKGMDVSAKLAKKTVIKRNKKAFRMQQNEMQIADHREAMSGQKTLAVAEMIYQDCGLQIGTRQTIPATEASSDKHGSKNIQYIEHVIKDGDLETVVSQLDINATAEENDSQSDPKLNGSNGSYSTRLDPQLMVISLHSCGNLVHHGLRSLLLNESVKAVAMVGCCYNLVTERLGPPSYKLPALRPAHPRLDRSSSTYDPHGFPMSERLVSYKHRDGKGIRMNITARMMAVQAPQNWTPTECEGFFTRHFYRALLQKVFMDIGVVEKPSPLDPNVGSGSPRGWSGGGHPIIIGSLRKACYSSFAMYARGAVDKIGESSGHGAFIKERMASLSDADLLNYYEAFKHKKHELSLIWSLMAFSAGVMESVIVVDRWLWLKEQEEVGECWVQTVFEYEQSPRNLVVVGIKK
ncbi:hypothetical protein MMC26_005378 [Xylographa opegraphella]|nr:hypothetical protein [Xylographa opegraphella]